MLEIGNLTPVELSRTILQPVSSVVKKPFKHDYPLAKFSLHKVTSEIADWLEVTVNS